jgi:UDP-glucose 4-epimerase
VGSQTVLLTGGAGYIGSHTAVEMLASGRDVVVVDDFSNSSPVVLDQIAGLVPSGKLRWHRCDIADTEHMTAILGDEDVDAVVHFAGLKAVAESVAEPLRYYRVNVGGTASLLRAMDTAGVRRLVFSSSCTVYGDPAQLPIDESAPRSAANPYGRTKLIIEDMLGDLAASDDRWEVLLLRYFNPVGSHPSGRIGEDPRGIPNNLMPYIMQVATGRHPFLRVFGDDYPTRDGTCIRDYIHVVDLAAGHVAALDGTRPGCRAVNLGTGQGHTVLEVVAAASRAVGQEIPYRIVDRRPGDVAATWADPSLAHELLGWRATRDLDAMAADHWRWQSQNPDGYATPAETPDESTSTAHNAATRGPIM